jgi:hypothetical protein
MGDLVAAQTNDNQNPADEDGFRFEQLSGKPRLIAADGTVLS